MARRRRDNEEGSIWEFIGGVVLLYLLYIAFLYNSNRAAYWQQVWYFVAFVIIVCRRNYRMADTHPSLARKRSNDFLSAVKQTV